MQYLYSRGEKYGQKYLFTSDIVQKRKRGSDYFCLKLYLFMCRWSWNGGRGGDILFLLSYPSVCPLQFNSTLKGLGWGSDKHNIQFITLSDKIFRLSPMLIINMQLTEKSMFMIISTQFSNNYNREN